MEDPFEQMEQLLSTWNLPQLSAIFREQEITLEALDALTDADIESLIPKVGPRALFRKRLKEWIQTPKENYYNINTQTENEAKSNEQQEIFSYIDEDDNEVEVLNEVWLTDDINVEDLTTDVQETEDLENDDVEKVIYEIEANVIKEQKGNIFNFENTTRENEEVWENVEKSQNKRIGNFKKLINKKINEKTFDTKTGKFKQQFEETKRIIKKEKPNEIVSSNITVALSKDAIKQRHCQRIGRNWGGLNVEELLMCTEAGRSILEGYETNPCLNKRTRYFLADLIVTEIFAKNLIMDRYKFDNIANQIVTLFPTEEKDSWFLPQKSSQKSSGGTLYYKYYSTYTKMRKTGFYQHYVDGVSKHLDSDATLSAEIEKGNYSIKLKDFDDDADKLAFKRAIPRYERLRNSTDFERIDVKELLESSYEGLGLIETYEKHQYFDVQARNRICKLVCMEGINRNIKMQPKDFYDISCQIVELFPNEKHETYFLPRGKTPPKGCLYHKYIYLIRRFKKMGLTKNSISENEIEETIEDEADNLI